MRPRRKSIAKFFAASHRTPSHSAPTGTSWRSAATARVVRLWDVRTRKLVHELDQAGNGAFTLEFSPDGRTLAISGFEPFCVSLGRC